MKSRYVDESDLSAVLAAAKKDAKRQRDYLPLLVSLETGLRVGDVVKIRRQDLAPDGIRYVAQKTGKEGFARITARTRRALVENAGETGENWVFPSPTRRGQHITRQAVWKRAKRLARLADIAAAGFSPHSMRKNFAVETYKRSGLAATQAALQHSRADTTELYALSDFLTGDNADKPLLRRDVDLLFKLLQDFIISEIRNNEAPS